MNVRDLVEKICDENFDKYPELFPSLGTKFVVYGMLLELAKYL